MNDKSSPVDPEHPGTSGPTPAMVHISGIRRGRTDRLSGVAFIDPSPDSGIVIATPDESKVADHLATLHPMKHTYELAVAPGKTIWVNGEKVGSKVLQSGDLLEIGDGGPILRFRIYAAGAQIYKSASEVFADCLDCVRREPRPLPSRIVLLLTGLVRELTTQTSIRFRVVIFSMITTLLIMLILTTILLTRYSIGVDARLAEEQTRLSGLSELVRRVQDDTFDRQELAEMRDALEGDLSVTVQRLEQLEERSRAVRLAVAEAAQSTVFIQGGFGFEDPKTNRPLRLMLGPDGEPLRTLRGIPAVTLEGEGPVLEVTYTGTAFLVAPEGYLLTSRHLAEPWESGDEYEGILALGLTPVMQRLIGYLPDRVQPFDLEPVAVSDDADLALLRWDASIDRRSPLRFSERPPIPGDEVVVLGYPTGVRALLARAGKTFVDNLSKQRDLDFWTVARYLSEAGHISPLATRGIVGQVTSEAVVYDAETTRGGSGGPVLGIDGEVIAITAQILPEFGGSNIGVPVRYARELVATAVP